MWLHPIQSVTKSERVDAVEKMEEISNLDAAAAVAELVQDEEQLIKKNASTVVCQNFGFSKDNKPSQSEAQ